MASRRVYEILEDGAKKEEVMHQLMVFGTSQEDIDSLYAQFVSVEKFYEYSDIRKKKSQHSKSRSRNDERSRQGNESHLGTEREEPSASGNTGTAEDYCGKDAPNPFQNQPLEIDLYQKALKDGVEEDKSVRVNIVGSYGQGKTSVMKRLLYKDVSDVESTNGIDVLCFECKISQTGEVNYKEMKHVENKDIIRRFQSVSFPTEKDTNQNPDLTERLEEPSSKITYNIEVPENAIQSTEIPASQQLTEKEKEAINEALKKRPFKETTESTNIYLNFWDFGGQFVFYATHSIFHSREAIYLLVFNLTLPLQTTIKEEDFPGEECKRTVEYYLRFWMNSVHSFVGTKDGLEPVVILVGTHKDQIPGDPLEKDTYIEEFFNEVRKLFDGTPMLNHIYEENFAVANTLSSDDSFAALREAILDIGKKMSMRNLIPAKWIQLELTLDRMKSLKITQLENILDEDSKHEIPLGNVEQVKLFLKYHHDKGTYIYFDEAPISHYVILDPQFLIDAFKSIITSKQFCTRSARLRPNWNLLVEEAILKDELIQSKWEKNEMFIKYKDILIAFLVKHYIMNEVQVFDEATQSNTALGWYIVPSLLKDSQAGEEIQNFMQSKQGTLLQCALKFRHSAIVPLVYQRLQAALVGKWPLIKYRQKKTQVMIFQKACIVKINNFAGIARLDTPSICLAVVSLCPSLPVDFEVTDSFRRFCESLVQHEFRKLRAKTDVQPYEVKFKCNHESHGIDGSYEYLETHKNPLTHCPDFIHHEIDISKGKGQWYAESERLNVDLDRPVTERVLSSLAQAVGGNWQLLGIRLGLKDIQIQHIYADNPTTVLRVFKMLMMWKENAVEATLKALVQAMKGNKAVTIDWDIVWNIVDETK